MLPLSALPDSTARLDIRLDVVAPDATRRGDVRDDVLGVFDACAPVVHRYVRSCGVTADVADDIVQETFLLLFQHLRKGGNRVNLQGWVMQVGYRLALKHRRRESRQGRWLKTWDTTLEKVADPADGPEEACGTNEERQRLRAVLRALPRRERTCVYLRSEGMRYREIAEILGVSLGAVAKSIARAYGRLSAVKQSGVKK
jgi:RNA polymerase sigma-70 factor (ECF subfamily)